MSSSTPTYSLHYFDIRGLAEPARILFHLAKVEFEDKRYPYKNAEGKMAEWDAVKASYVYEKVPVLFTEGVAIAQSGAINRFLARRFGFLGSNETESALIDGVGEQINDLKRGFWAVKEKPEEVSKWYSNDLKNLFRLFARQQQATKSASGHLIGSKISLADVILYLLIEFMADTDKALEVAAEYPTIVAVYNKLHETPGVSKK